MSTDPLSPAYNPEEVTVDLRVDVRQLQVIVSALYVYRRHGHNTEENSFGDNVADDLIESLDTNGMPSHLNDITTLNI